MAKRCMLDLSNACLSELQKQIPSATIEPARYSSRVIYPRVWSRVSEVTETRIVSTEA
jgi:hypothetical protein